MREPSGKWVDKVLGQVKPRLAPFAGRKIGEPELRTICGILFAEAMPKSVAVTDDMAGALWRTLEHLLGGEHSHKMLMSNALRAVANWHFIREGMEVPMWDGSAETMSLIVIGLKRLATGDYMMLVKLKSGLAAGIIQCTVARTSAIGGFLDHASGACQYNCAAEEIAGMRFRAVVELRPDGSVKLSSWSTTDAMRKHNKDLAERRGDPTRCRNPIPCNACSKTVRECPLAVWLPEPKEKHG